MAAAVAGAMKVAAVAMALVAAEMVAAKMAAAAAAVKVAVEAAVAAEKAADEVEVSEVVATAAEEAVSGQMAAARKVDALRPSTPPLCAWLEVVPNGPQEALGQTAAQPERPPDRRLGRCPQWSSRGRPCMHTSRTGCSSTRVSVLP